jgi:hypothetical protein
MEAEGAQHRFLDDVTREIGITDDLSSDIIGGVEMGDDLTLEL